VRRGRDGCGLQGSLQGGPVGQGPIRGCGGRQEQGGFQAEEDWDVVGASSGEGVGPVCEVWGEQGASKSQVKDAWGPNERHGEPSENARGVEEGEPKICGPIEVGGPGGYLILLKESERVGCGVVDVKVTQGECGEG